MERKSLRKAQGGFTLIEIIAVLVILGILAAVAVPRFIDLQDQARQRALEGALAEGLSTVNMAFASELLTGPVPGTATAAAVATRAAANTPESTDFQYTFAATGNTTIRITVEGRANTGFDGMSAFRDWVHQDMS